MFGQQFFEGDHPFHTHQRIQLLTGIGEVFAQALVDADATGHQFMLEHLLEQAGATAATGTGLGLRLEQAKVGAAAVDGRANRAFGDVMAGATVADSGKAPGPRVGAPADGGKIRLAGSAGSAMPFCMYCSNVS